MLQAVFTKNVNKIEVSGLTQWDYGQKLEITLAGLPESFEAHFAYRGATEAPVVKGTAVDGVATVPIPNILTTQKNEAVCWLYYKDGESGETVKTILLPIKARQKPTDYVYTETEVVSYTSLLKRVEELENNGASDDAIASAVAKWLEKNPIESGTSDAVQYVKQTLTEEQQAQARTNIGAASAKEVSQLSATVNDLTLGVHTDGLVYIFINGEPVGNGLNISGGTDTPDTPDTPSATDNITLADGVMTILGLAKEPTLTESILTIA